MNIIITGKRRSGKTSAVNSLLPDYEGAIAGFRTHFEPGREPESRRVSMTDIASGKRAPVISWRDDIPEADINAFDSFGVSCLSSAGSGLVVMDELGRFEEGAEKFRAAVNAVFDGDCDTLAVVAESAVGWTRELMLRGDVYVIRLTEDNRSAVPDMLREMLLERRKKA